MVLWITLVVGLVAGLVGSALVFARLTERQRLRLEASRDAAVRSAVEQLVAHNHAVLDGERSLGAEQLDARRALIDQQFTQVTDRIGEFERYVRDVDGRQREQFGALASNVAALTQTTQQLREVLASSKARGQWGERMAEDVLRLAGLIEGINYRKQHALASGTVPDYTFLMPNDVALHMDVKFPLDNYVRFLEAGSDLERDQHRRGFLRDVANRVKELTARGYLDDRDTTVECLLLFVPNESVFAFIQEHDPQLVEDALRRNVLVCSPLTLFAILRVVRQAVDNFRLERTANEILRLLNEFEGQWSKYSDKLDKVQRAFGTVQKDFDELMTTRTRGLQRPLDKIATLRNNHDLALVEADPRPMRAVALEA